MNKHRIVSRIANAPGHSHAVSGDFPELAIDERRRVDRGVYSVVLTLQVPDDIELVLEDEA